MRSSEIEEWLAQSRGRPREGGITAVDLLDLPAPLSPIMRVLFMHGSLTGPQIQAALQEAAETSRRESVDLDEALEALCEQRWLIRSGRGEPDGGPLYRVNLRTRARVAGGPDRWEVLDFER